MLVIAVIKIISRLTWAKGFNFNCMRTKLVLAYYWFLFRKGDLNKLYLFISWFIWVPKHSCFFTFHFSFIYLCVYLFIFPRTRDYFFVLLFRTHLRGVVTYLYMNNLWFSVTSNRIIFTCKVMNRDVFVGMWAKWMKTTQPICHSQRWKRAAATWSFKLVRTVSTFLPTYSKWTNQIRSQEAKKHTNLCPSLFSTPPFLPGDSPCSWCVRHRCSNFSVLTLIHCC